MHRIVLEDGAKDVVQAQRRLDQTLKEVVMKEMFKLNDASIIYMVPNSTWVSPIHVVSKKTRMTMTKNDKGEMVPTGVQNKWRMCIDYRKLNEVYDEQLNIFSDFVENCIEVFMDDFTVYGDNFDECLNEKCCKAFDVLKEKSTTAPILPPPRWDLPFEIICDASNLAVGAVLGQRIDKKAHVIYYASRTLNPTQANYTTAEKEFLAIIFALDKSRSYVLGSPITIFTDHATIRYLVLKKESKRGFYNGFFFYKSST
ncbi:hypothetical protein E5676_scaffold755G00210 [Cucumis melo var. makuwa]|uniref:Reverse transcriptase/retrotransposon-derived protein RNase H-like domain-containing protein n=1 Tax=Cucumis melo var. makuwa TaxID=1194695 RepID=A0A5D3BXT8_CUCMM|nr:hypothetical protein E5676_scaffold755G00210 [Cucumis melo var. makuwa]